MNGMLYVLVSLLIVAELIGILTLAIIAWRIFKNTL